MSKQPENTTYYTCDTCGAKALSAVMGPPPEWWEVRVPRAPRRGYEHFCSIPCLEAVWKKDREGAGEP